MKLKSYLRGLGTGLFISAVLMGIATSGRVKELSDSEIKQRAAALGMVEEDKVLAKPAAEETQAARAEVKEEPEKTEVKADNDTDKIDSGTDDKKEEIKKEDTKEEDKKEETGEEEAEIKEEDKAADNAGEDKKEDSDDIRDSKEDRAMGGKSQSGELKDDETPMIEPTEAPKSSNEKVSGLKNSSGDLGYNEYFTIQIASGSTSETVSGLLKRGGAIDNADEFDDYLCENHYDKKITPGLFKIPVGADYKQIAEIITGN